jgi:hypothetical protein
MDDATAEQPNPVEAQLHRIAGALHSAGNMRPAGSSNRCHTASSGLVRTAVEEQADGQRHVSADQMSGLVRDLLDLRGGSLQQLRPSEVTGDFASIAPVPGDVLSSQQRRERDGVLRASVGVDAADCGRFYKRLIGVRAGVDAPFRGGLRSQPPRAGTGRGPLAG